MKKPDAILTSDWHLREDQPTCRTDNFWEAQWKKVAFIREYQLRYDCPVLHAGDLFHHWKPSPHLLSMAIEYLPEEFYTVYGQHDLPNHNLDLDHKSGIHTLLKAGKLQVIGVHWGQKPNQSKVLRIKSKKIIIWHNFTYIGKEPFPGAKGKAFIKLKKYGKYDLIVTGDNHQSFYLYGDNGNLLVNPGNITRQVADQINFKPKIYLWYAESNTVEAIELPIETGVITREHIERKQKRDERIDAFVSKLNTDWNMSLNFEDNLNKFFEKNRIRKQVKDIIYKAMDNE